MNFYSEVKHFRHEETNQIQNKCFLNLMSDSIFQRVKKTGHPSFQYDTNIIFHTIYFESFADWISIEMIFIDLSIKNHTWNNLESKIVNTRLCIK